MLIDANDVPGDVRADVCIVGAGAAGITLALELARQRLSVAVLESGGTEREEAVEALAGGVTTGRPYPLATTRLRYLGGATNHWSGFCRPLDPIDFEARPWIPYSGWPFPREELDPYYERAQTVCGLGPYEYDVDWWRERIGLETLPDDEVLATALFQVSPPVRFGEEYGPALTAATNVAVYLHADVVALDLDPDGEAVARARVATLGGSSWSASARVFVLATGAIETARVLLVSRDQQAEGIGNANDLVGRFFMEHAHLPRAAVAAVAGADSTLDLYRGGVRPLPDELLPKRGLLGALTLSEDVRRAEQLPGAALSFNPWVARDEAAVVAPGDVASLLADEGSPAPVAAMDVFLRSEQVPDPENRVTLTDGVDALGVPLVALNWEVGALDLDCIRRTLEIVATRVGLEGSRVQIEPEIGTPAANIFGGAHHMGTTRMNVDPELGVVDAQCRVHDVENLYVAGSAVFPTAGYANPTLTLIALTLRLADELRRRLVGP